MEFSFTKLFDTYWHRLPLTCKDAFWFKPLVSQYPPAGKPGLWYTTIPIGRNKLGGFVKEMMESAGYGGENSNERYTNHSLRNVTANTLVDNNFSDFDIMSRTGHSSVNSLQAYRRKNASVVNAMSDVLSEPARIASAEYRKKLENQESDDQKAVPEAKRPKLDLKSPVISFEAVPGVLITEDDFDFGSGDEEVNVSTTSKMDKDKIKSNFSLFATQMLNDSDCEESQEKVSSSIGCQTSSFQQQNELETVTGMKQFVFNNCTVTIHVCKCHGGD